MTRLLAAPLLVLVFAAPAEAHKLKVFATVEGDAVKGYAFFVGGGRAQGTDWVASSGPGTRLAEGKTDGEGRFVFAVPGPPASGVTITVDTHEGHIASATLPAARFGALTVASQEAGERPGPEPRQPSAEQPSPSEQQIAALVAAAVQRQVEPLMEQIEQMDSRLRYADILSGVFLILGLAGMALWASGRRR
jgi:nickel transport protein